MKNKLNVEQRSTWIRKLRSSVCGLLGVLLLNAPATHAAEPSNLLTEFGRANLIIEASSKSCILFDVYVAAQPTHWRQGLMFIRSLDRFQGMIFVYPEARELSMWMKNTLIPLDMLFVGTEAGGASRVKHLHRNARPHSEEIISSGTDVSQVIELNGGAAEEFGIEPGDRVIFPAG